MNSFLLAEANPDASQLGNWLLIGMFVVNSLVALGGVLAFFATRRELEAVEKRTGALETDLRAMRDRNETDKTEMLEAGEGRARRLHERMDQVRTEVLSHADAMRAEFNKQLHDMPSRIIQDLANFKQLGGAK